MIGSPDHPVLTFGLPPDAAAWFAFALACLVPFLKVRPLSVHSRLLILCCLGGVLSFGYFLYYLGSAPRIIDATTYLLEARSFAQGSFSFEVPAPSASFRGRFLIHTAADPARLAGIFPPGYPALLAVGVFLGVPFLVGPLLGSALVYSTYGLTYAVTRRKEDALIAACLSALCACLRYHTAETMSHGFAALLTVVALWSTVELLRAPHKYADVFLGLSLGLLCATRQLTGIVLAVSTIGTLLLSRRTLFARKALLAGKTHRRELLRVGVALLPGVVLLLAHHYAVTGDPFTSPQSRYYEFADGPPGCFGLGLGKGCAYEHADVVQQQGGKGLTPLWMVRNTLHRFHFHLMDVAHFEPLVIVGLLGVWWGRRRPVTWPLALVLVLVPFAYSLFYFAGSYPGGGARLFAEMIPIWHVFIAWGLCRLRLARVGIAACLFGFSLHASFSHGALAAPHFGPWMKPLPHIENLVSEWKLEEEQGSPLIFFKTAHEFNLAHLQSDEFVAARRTFDSREEFVARSTGIKRLLGYDASSGFAAFEDLPVRALGPVVLETEFDYPPLGKRDLWVHPEHLPQACVSRGRALALHLTGPAPRLLLEGLPQETETYSVELYGIDAAGQCVRLDLGRRSGSKPLVLEGRELKNLSHIDRLELTPTHL